MNNVACCGFILFSYLLYCSIQTERNGIHGYSSRLAITQVITLAIFFSFYEVRPLLPRFTWGFLVCIGIFYFARLRCIMLYNLYFEVASMNFEVHLPHPTIEYASNNGFNHELNYSKLIWEWLKPQLILDCHIQASKLDSGNYSCGVENYVNASLTLHVFQGILQQTFKVY